MAAIDQERERLANQLYERYAKPLEQEHWGMYIAVTPGGKYVLGENLLGVLEQAVEMFGPGNFVFKVGEKMVLRFCSAS